MRSTTAAVIVAAAVAWSGSPVLAQDGTTPGAPVDKPGLSVTWDHGVSIESAGGDRVLQLGGLLQLDGRFTPDDSRPTAADTLVFRRIRPLLLGRAGKHFEFRFMPDFANKTVVLFDAYVDARFSKTFRIRIGKDKTPVGLEQLYADYAILFPERSLVTNLVPNRDVGIQARGDLGGGVVSYIGGVFTGVRDSSEGAGSAEGGPDLVGRLTFRPFNGGKIAALQGAGMAVGATRGHEMGALPSFRSTAQQRFFAYAASASADGERTRVSPSAFYYYKALGTFAEYARTTQAVKGTAAAADVTNTAWGITGSFVLTGETASERGVLPNRPFDPEHGHWGALQLIARYSHLAVDPIAFADHFASSTSSRIASASGIGAGWYANAYVKCVLIFERTVFDDDPRASRRPEHAVVFRLQFNLQPA